MGSTTLSSREFLQDTEAARKAAYRGPVIITDGGQPAHVLLSVSEYARLAEGSEKNVRAETKQLRGRSLLEALSGSPRSIVELLAMPELDGLPDDFEFPKAEFHFRIPDFED